MQIECPSIEATRKIGRAIGANLIAGDVVALHGDLGAGKTTLVGGIAQGLGVPGEFSVTSPTFVLMHVYPGRIDLVHVDFYRLENMSELSNLGLEEYLGMDAVCVVEWFEKFPSAWTGDTIHLHLSMKNEHTRIIEIKPCGARSTRLISQLENARE